MNPNNVDVPIPIIPIFSIPIIDLTEGICETNQYKAWKFPGGEIHLKFKTDNIITQFYGSIINDIKIYTRLNSSDDLLLLILSIDTIKKIWPHTKLYVFIPYMPYQQADRNFDDAECFSLKTITNILNTLDVESYIVYDPHSDVTPALLKNCKIIDNSDYINSVISNYIKSNDLTILSPDAGAYKKIFKLADKIKFKGQIATANKSRSITTGNIDSIEISENNFNGKDILIIDDICIGGRTFIELAKKLHEKNIGKLYLAISHGIFSNGFEELSKYFTRIYTTNSRNQKYNSDLIEVIDIRYNSIYIKY